MELHTARVVCPGCNSAMQVWHLGEIEIDRCTFCGGIWFDRDELGAALEKGPLPAPGPDGKRSCPHCEAPLGRLEVEGVTLDGCRSCGGTYFDQDELDRLAGQRVKLQHPSDRHPITYDCPGCGRTVRHGDGHITARGYACHSCAPSLTYDVPGSATASPRQDARPRSGRTFRRSGGISLLSLLYD